MFEKFIEDIRSECINNSIDHSVPDWMPNDLFEYTEYDPCWRLINGKDPGYIIGLSEDHYDYYWIYVTPDMEVKFMTCCFDVSKKYTDICHTFNDFDKFYIRHTVKSIIENNSSENLIYLHI